MLVLEGMFIGEELCTGGSHITDHHTGQVAAAKSRDFVALCSGHIQVTIRHMISQ
jgi:hypothetical protein